MGKSTPKAPTPPDPVATANAQGQMNKDTAVAQANLDRINQYTPYGSLVYSQIGTNADGTPKFQSTQTLSPEQQKLYNTQTTVEQNMNNLALTNMNRVNQAQSTPFNYNGMTPMVTGVSAGSVSKVNPTQLDLQSSVAPGAIKGSYGQGGNVQSQINAPGTSALQGFDGMPGEIVKMLNAPTQQIQQSLAQQKPLATGVQQGQMQLSPADTFAMQNGYTQTPYDTSFHPGSQVQSGLGSAGNVAGNYDASKYTTTIDTAPEVQQQLAFGALGALPGSTDFSGQGQKVADAMYQQAQSRLDPQYAQIQNDLQTRLASMGISQGSDAYNREMDNFARNRTDAYNDANFRAIQASGTEQSRQFADALSARQEGVNEGSLAGNFANAAQGQIFGQNQSRAQFANSATQAQNADNASQAQFHNSAQQQQFGQNQASGEFANAAQQQQFGQNQALAQFRNDAIGHNNADAASQAQFHNSAQQQQFAQNASRMDQINAAQAQMFNQGQQNAQLQNTAAGQFFNQNVQAGQFANQAQQQGFDQNAAAATFANQAQNQRFGQNQQQAQFFNQGAQQNFNNAQTQGQFANAAQQQQYAQNQQNAAFANDAQQQQFAQGSQNAALKNSTQQQQYDSILSALGFNNQAQNQQFNQNAANAQLQNTARQQQIQESTYLRNLPLNEISALLGTGAGVQNPTFTAVPQVGVAAPDYQGLVSNNYNQAMGQYNNQMAAQSSMMGSIFGGLGGLGSAAIMASDRRLKEDVRHVGELHNGIGLYSYRYVGNDNIEIGVMAQEVFGVRPDAVVDIDGFHAVDYRKVAA